MVLEEYEVHVRGFNGRSQRKFTYWVDPRKKPNIKSVLVDFKHDSQISNVDEWKLCTLGGHEIRWLADYADRILVLMPVEPAKLPEIRNSWSSSTLSALDDGRTSEGSSGGFLPSLAASDYVRESKMDIGRGSKYPSSKMDNGRESKYASKMDSGQEFKHPSKMDNGRESKYPSKLDVGNGESKWPSNQTNGKKIVKRRSKSTDHQIQSIEQISRRNIDKGKAAESNRW